MYRVTTDIFCETCGNWEHGVVSLKVEAHNARKNVKRFGWYSYRGLDYCPACVAERLHIKHMEKVLDGKE